MAVKVGTTGVVHGEGRLKVVGKRRFAYCLCGKRYGSSRAMSCFQKRKRHWRAIGPRLCGCCSRDPQHPIGRDRFCPNCGHCGLTIKQEAAV